MTDTLIDLSALKTALDFLDQGFTQWPEEKQLFLDAARAYYKEHTERSSEISGNAQQIYDAWSAQSPSEAESVCALAHKCYAAGFNEGVDIVTKRESGHPFTENELKQIRPTVGAMRLQMERNGLWQPWWIKFIEWALSRIEGQEGK